MSNKWLITTVLAAILILPASAALPQTALEMRIQDILDQSSIDPAQTGVAVVSVNRERTLASINGNETFNPASCAKIVTGTAALATLGPDYRFETSFYTDRRSAGGGVGDLYVVGSGDPSFVSEEMMRAVGSLISSGLRRVDGDIVVDDSFFDGPWYPKKNGDDGRAFTAATSAFSFNFNSAKFVIEPGSRAGRPAVVTTDPPTSYIKIINKVATGGKFKAFIAHKGASEGGETFLVTGSIPARAQPQFFYRVVADPARYAGSVLRDMLIQNGVAVRGGVRKGPLPAGTAHMLKQRSKPLNEIVRDMNKFSNNFIAEQLVKHLGAVKKGMPGSTAKGIEVLENFLQSWGVARGTYMLENGSGLSTVSRISASQLAKILAQAYKDRATHPDFIESLSILGTDGTMKNWRFAPELVGWLRAKTGSLANVSALAGYVPMKNGEIAAFAILANGFKKGKYSAHEAELMITQAIAEAGR